MTGHRARVAGTGVESYRHRSRIAPDHKRRRDYFAARRPPRSRRRGCARSPRVYLVAVVYRRGALGSMAIGLCLLAPGRPAAAGDGPPEPASVYEIRPIVDGAVTIASLLAIAIPYALASDLITPSCP